MRSSSSDPRRAGISHQPLGAAGCVVPDLRYAIMLGLPINYREIRACLMLALARHRARFRGGPMSSFCLGGKESEEPLGCYTHIYMSRDVLLKFIFGRNPYKFLHISHTKFRIRALEAACLGLLVVYVYNGFNYRGL